MPKLTPAQERELFDDVKKGDKTTADLARKYNMTWKHMAYQVRKARAKIEGTPAPVRDEPAQPKGNEETRFNIPDGNDDDMTGHSQLIEPAPAPAPTTKPELDPEKFYCKNCYDSGHVVEITHDHDTCPKCGRWLRWA